MTPVLPHIPMEASQIVALTHNVLESIFGLWSKSFGFRP